MPQGLSAGPQRPTGPARREAGQSQDRAERAEGHPGPARWRARPLRAAPHTHARRRRTVPRMVPWMVRVQSLHPVAAPVAPRPRVGRTPFPARGAYAAPRWGSYPQPRRRWQLARGQVQRPEIAATLSRRCSSAALLRGAPPDLLAQFLSHSLRYAGSSDVPTVILDLQFRGAQVSVLPFVVAKEPCCLVGCRMVFGVHGLERPQSGTAAPPLRSPT